jgi:hypothetical protein
MNLVGPSLCTLQYSGSQKLSEAQRSLYECVYRDYNHKGGEREREKERNVREWITELKKKE